jgi:hypothetical protein
MRASSIDRGELTATDRCHLYLRVPSLYRCIQYPFYPQLIYSILKGRLVVVLGLPRNEEYVAQSLRGPVAQWLIVYTVMHM